MNRELHSLRGLAWRLGVPLEQLKKLAATADDQYDPFLQRRRGRNPRHIDNPLDDIKEVQRLIRRVFFANQPLSESVRACVKGGSPLKHARHHVGQRNVAGIDVKNCYPSITNAMTYRVCRSVGLGPKTARLVTRLITRLGHLPQGAPTSDMVANLYLRELDRRAEEVARTLGLRYGRCLDGVDISGDANVRLAIPLVIQFIHDLGLDVRHKKTRNAGRGKPQLVAGYLVNRRDGPKVEPAKVQEVRTAVYQMVRAHQRGEPIDKRLRSVRGSLAYLSHTNKGLVRRLQKQIAAAGISLVGRRRRR